MKRRDWHESNWKVSQMRATKIPRLATRLWTPVERCGVPTTLAPRLTLHCKRSSTADLAIRYAADVDQFEVPCAYDLDQLRIVSAAFGAGRVYETDSDRGSPRRS